MSPALQIGLKLLGINDLAHFAVRRVGHTPISLAAHQTTVVYLDKLLKDVHVNNEGIGQGGLSITHNGPAGALIAHGFIQSKTGRYVSNLDFIDPAGEMSSVLEARGLMLGYPASTTVFPAPSYFTPVLALRNA